jgi:two-component system CheB/CheR fusion protein
MKKAGKAAKTTRGESTRQRQGTQAPETSLPRSAAKSVSAIPKSVAEIPTIVGIGASAGGLEAFTRLVRRIPPNTGLAYVLVQHLDPEHESMLPNLLAREASIPVRQVADGMKVLANHAYVIPPNTTMSITDGHLRLAERKKMRGPPMPIDGFFSSLAETHQSGALGIILSGTGSDGARGIEAIKAAGGITIAQSAGSARFPSMPESAVATGHVDFVLPPEEIAEKLAKIGQHLARHDTAKPTPSPEEENELRKILQLLQSRTGVDFRNYRRATVHRRILRRMLLHRRDTHNEYLNFLRDNPEELDALYEDMLIDVTSFFRDPEVFAALESTGFPQMMKNREPAGPIRVWVAGCAGGEETYSIAISLLEYLAKAEIEETPVQIFATDLSNSSINKARAGLYTEGIEATVSPERLERFFVKEELGYRISKNVRDLCVFSRQNVMRDPPFSHLDLISCRNVLIYLEATTQKRIFPIFHYALKPNGLLVLGTAESASTASTLFEALDKRHKLYLRRGTGTSALDGDLAIPGFEEPRARTARHGPSRERNHDDVQTEADRLMLARFAPGGVVVNDALDIVQFRGQTSPFLEHVAGAASLNLLKLARQELVPPLRSAIHIADSENRPARNEHVRLKEQGKLVTIDVIPFRSSFSRGRFFVVTFIEEVAHSRAEKVGRSKDLKKTEPKRTTRGSSAAHLRQELEETRSYLQDVIEEYEATNEELRAANEEVQSANEELQSTNEELETTKEEIQSTNEELNTVNEELRHRNTELTSLSSDLSNVLASSQVPMVIVGSDMAIRRFTPAADKIMKLIPSDVGRPLADVKLRIELPDLEQRIASTVGTLTPFETEVRDDDGRWWVRADPSVPGGGPAHRRRRHHLQRHRRVEEVRRASGGSVRVEAPAARRFGAGADRSRCGTTRCGSRKSRERRVSRQHEPRSQNPVECNRRLRRSSSNGNSRTRDSDAAHGLRADQAERSAPSVDYQRHPEFCEGRSRPPRGFCDRRARC